MAASHSHHLSQGVVPVAVALQAADAHRRQRELVRASLVARPATTPRPMHRRWA
ncbi:MAG TPA: hypothetical protein VGP78_09320 [Solirubrobacteraceae bacterium]|jgi:hypothetical protein|nr:hypothetical protein [Solirubrobacteraceae bacterium]